MERRIALEIAYDGGAFCGSQRQAMGRTVQGEIEDALDRVFGHRPTLTLAGRTDAGVHALGQVGAFTTERVQPPLDRVPLALNANLDKAVRITRVWGAELSFHPRFDARERTYVYRIERAGLARSNPLIRCLAAPVREPLDLDAMRAGAVQLIGRHDFAAWQSAGSPARTTVREIRRLEVRPARAWGSDLIEIEIAADAFLYQMVRNIVGALIEIGRGRLEVERLARLTRGLDRTACPPPAPPQGLCLERIEY